MKLLIGLALAMTTAAAPEPRPDAARTAPRRQAAWQVDWGDQYCTLVRLPDRNTPFVVSIRALPGGHDATLILVESGRGRLPSGISAVSVDPAQRSFQVRVVAERRPGGRRALVLHDLPNHFLDTLSGAHALQLSGGGRVRRRIDLRQAGTAVRQCISDALREWDIDEAALSALREWPVSTNMMGLRHTDYPEESLRRRSQGRVVVRIDVSPEGRITACLPIASSGDRALDSTTCRIILERARFTPAIGADGRPVAARIAATVTWRT